MRLIDADVLIESIKDDLYYQSEIWYKIICDSVIKCIEQQEMIYDKRRMKCERCGQKMKKMYIYMNQHGTESQNIWNGSILCGLCAIKMYRLGSENNGCWIKCKDCANTRCTRRYVEEDGDDE